MHGVYSLLIKSSKTVIIKDGCFLVEWSKLKESKSDFSDSRSLFACQDYMHPPSRSDASRSSYKDAENLPFMHFRVPTRYPWSFPKIWFVRQSTKKFMVYVDKGHLGTGIALRSLASIFAEFESLEIKSGRKWREVEFDGNLSFLSSERLQHFL